MPEDRAYYDNLHQMYKKEMILEFSDIKDSPFGRLLQPIRKKHEQLVFYYPDFQTCHARFTKARNIKKYEKLTRLH